MRARTWVWAAVFAVAVPGASLGAEEPPVRRIDRMWVVGAPVLEGARRGVYVWVEDRAVQLAAVGKGRIRVQIAATAALDLDALGDFRPVGSARGGVVVLESRPKDGVARGRITTDGDVTVSRARSRRGRPRKTFVGPLARPGASAVTIGRF